MPDSQRLIDYSKEYKSEEELEPDELSRRTDYALIGSWSSGFTVFMDIKTLFKNGRKLNGKNKA